MALTYGFIFGEDTSSAQFSDAFHALVGDGITPEGMKMAVTINGFRATAATGYALAAGRWVQNDSPLSLSIPASGNNNDRIDAVAVRVDYEARKAAIEVIVDVDIAAVRANPALLRTDEQYCILLYLIRVRRGVSTLSPEDVTDVRADKDLCGMLTPLSGISSAVLTIYEFLTSGIDKEVARIIALGDELIARGGQQIKALDDYAKELHAVPDIGEIMISYAHPVPVAEWLLCDGRAIPAQFPELSELLSDRLPDIENGYIYGGRAV